MTITGRHYWLVDSNVTEGVITTQSNWMKFRLIPWYITKIAAESLEIQFSRLGPQFSIIETHVGDHPLW